MKKILSILAIILVTALIVTACNNNDQSGGSTATGDKTEQLAKDEMYTCTMHNEVMSDHEGKCPKCEMKLVKQKMTAEQQKMMNEGTYLKPKE